MESSNRRMGSRRAVELFVVLVAGWTAGCVSEPSAVTGEKRAYGYSWQQELQLGEQSDAQITQQMGLLDDPEMQSYVTDLGRRLVAHSDFRDADAPELYQDTRFNFRVLDSPVVNAFALPGGYVYVTRGLLTHAQNEAQLAVVLGHEIAHVTARHASQQALRSQLSQLGLFAGAIVGQQVLGDRAGNVAQTILEQGGAALQLLMFRYSREAEHESDSLGVRYALGAGYDTAQGAEFFHTLQRLSEREGKALPTWSSTHPDPGERAERVREMSGGTAIGGGPSPARVVNEADYLRRLEGMVLGDNPREGFRDGDRFVHPDLAFQFRVPSGWKLQNERSIVLLGDPNNQALVGFEMAPTASAREAANQLAQQQGVQVVSAQDAQVGGMPAVVVLGQANTEQGAVGFSATFVEHQQRVYSFLGYTSAQLFPQYQPIFQQVAASFSAVTDPAVLQVQPARLRVAAADRTAPFREFVPAVLPLGMTAESLAIMNQVELNETIERGRWLKLPQMQPGSSPPPEARPIGEPQRTIGAPAPTGGRVIGEPVIGQ